MAYVPTGSVTPASAPPPPGRPATPPSGLLSAPGTPLSKAQADAAARARIALIMGERRRGGSPIGRFLRNAAADVVATATGIPSAAVFLGKQAAGGGARVWDYTNLPGSGAADRFAGRRWDELVEAGREIGRTYKHTYGPLFRGDFGTFGSRVMDHPGFIALDAATLFTGAGAAARVTSKAADAAGVGQAGGALRGAHVKSIVAGPRVRPTETLTHEIPGGGTLQVEVRRRPMSKNPITRTVFQRPAARLVKNLRGRIGAMEAARAAEAVPRALPGVLEPHGPTARTHRVAKQEMRREAARKAGVLAATVNRESAPYDAALRGLKSYVDKDLQSRPHEAVALHYHQEGLLKQPGMTAVEAARHVVDVWSKEIARIKQQPGPRVRTSARETNVRALREIIDRHPDLLDEATAPKTLRKAIDESRVLGLGNEAAAQEAFGLTPAQIRARAELPARQIHGGQRIVQDLRPEQAALDAAQANLTRLSARSDRRAAWNQVQSDRGARRDAVRQLQAAQKTGDAAAVQTARAAVRDAARQVRTSEIAHARARAGYVNSNPRQVAAATRKVDQARAKLERQAGKARGRTMLTEPNVPGFAPDPDAVYKRHIPADRMKRAHRRELRATSGRFSAAEVHKTLGVLLRSGDMVIDPRLLIQATEEAHRAIGNRNSLKELIATAAYRDPRTGGIWVDREGVMKAAADPEHVALIDANALEKALRQGGDAPVSLDHAIFIGQAELKAVEGFGKRKQKRMVAVSRQAAEEWKRSLSPSFVLPYYDRLLTLWKGAVLTLAPRWYEHNVLSNTLQYALEAGPRDILAITRARAKHTEIRQAILDIAPTLEANFVRDLMGGGMTPKAARVAAGRRVESLFAVGFDFNNALEGVFRRGAFIAASKQFLRDEGVALGVRPKRVGGMSDTQIARALRDMPDELKAEVARKAELFMGNYTTFNKFEREALKRVFPFYCVDQETEALTQRGWVKGEDLRMTDLVVSAKQDGELTWSPVEAIYLDEYQGPMYRVKSRGIDALVTPGHKFVLDDGSLVDVDDLRDHHRLRVMGEAISDYPKNQLVDDALVEVVGWAVTEGHYKRNASGNITTIEIAQKDGRETCDQIRSALERAGARWHEFLAGTDHKIRYFGVTGDVAQRIQQIAPRRVMSPDFIVSLTKPQRELLLATLIAADGSVAARGKSDPPVFAQKDEKAADAFVSVATLAGYQTYKRMTVAGLWAVTLRTQKTVTVENLEHEPGRGAPPPRRLPLEDYDGYVWCPKTRYGNFVCRRGGVVHLTGNSWIRVMSKLAVNLPARHPLTAQFLAFTSRLAQPVENPYDPLLPVYQRGGIGPFASMSTNPFGQVAQFLEPIASGGGPMEFVRGVVGGLESPLIQIPVNELTGINQFTGRPFTAPPGHGGVDSYGRAPMRLDPRTGLPVDAPRPTPGFPQGVLAALPGESILRAALTLKGGGNRPYDTTSDLDLLKYALGRGAPAVDLFQPPPKRPRGVVSPVLKSQLSSFFFGAPLRDMDPSAVIARAEERVAAYQQAARDTARARARLAARLAAGGTP